MLRSLILAVVVAATALGGCGDDSEPPGTGSPTTDASLAADPGPIHVHGLGTNPADGALFIATHTGLFSVAEGETEAERVADRYQDTMGFTIVGSNDFLGSGHPDTREDLPPFLGLIRSTDGGESWQPISLLGKADFHILEASGETVYGYGSDFKTREQQLLVSSDGGGSWQQRPLPEPAGDDAITESLLSLAIDPEDPDHVIASGQEALWTSQDQGRHWQFLAADTGLLTWAEADSLDLVDLSGQVSTSADGGVSWEDAGSVGGEPAAFEAGGGELYAALHDGVIKRSTDGGETWSIRSTP